MYPKFKTIALCNKYLPFFVAKLGMKKFKIELHVYHSKSKLLKKRGVKLADTYGASFCIKETADIVLFYDMLEDRKDAMATLIHELLHVRLNPCLELVTINKDRALKKEEEIVQLLEKFIMDTLDFEKLMS